MTARRLDELREAVEVTTCAVVMDRDDGIVVALREGTDDILHALLHLGIGALHGVELDGASVLTGIDGADGTATHADTVVISAEEEDLLAGLWFTLLCIATAGIAYPASEHDDLVETISIGICFVGLVLEGKYRTTDQRLTELIPEVTSTIRCLRQDLTRRLI